MSQSQQQHRAGTQPARQPVPSPPPASRPAPNPLPRSATQPQPRSGDHEQLVLAGQPTADLGLRVVTVHAPRELTDNQGRCLNRWADRAWELSPQEWQDVQLTRLALASVLEARLLHVRDDRLSTYKLSKDPHQVTLRELSGLWRPHGGTAGQAFELAVADACQQGVAYVVEPLQKALRLLGVRDNEPPRMRVLGLEKVPPHRRTRFADDVLSDLAPGVPLRTGLAGRPRTAQNAMAQFTEGQLRHPHKQAGLTSAQRAEHLAEHRAAFSQLARADALVYTNTAVVATSMKLNRSSVPRGGGWRDVPLWITRVRGTEGTSVYLDKEARVPTVVVELADSRWTTCFDLALDVLDVLLRRLDLGRYAASAWLGRSGRPYLGTHSALIEQLVKRADEPTAQVCAALRETHPGVREMFEAQIIATSSQPATIRSLDTHGMALGWEREAGSECLTVGQSHLFFSPPKAA